MSSARVTRPGAERELVSMNEQNSARLGMENLSQRTWRRRGDISANPTARATCWPTTRYLFPMRSPCHKKHGRCSPIDRAAHRIRIRIQGPVMATIVHAPVEDAMSGAV